MKRLARLQYISDIHLEKRPGIIKLKPVGENLALLGDIGNPFKKNYKDFLKYTSLNWNKVFLIAGNHDLRSRNSEERIQEVASNFKNIEFLNNTKTKLNDYTVLGSTLWSEYYMDDYQKSFKWLKENIKGNKIIVLTHYLPSFKLIIKKYHTSQYKKYHSRFASNLEHTLKPPVKFWLCGHSHCTIEMKINDVECAINAVGAGKVTNQHLKFIDLE